MILIRKNWVFQGIEIAEKADKSTPKCSKMNDFVFEKLLKML